MVRLLLMIIPVLIPSWRFFQGVEPSPRVEVWHGGDWVAVCPRPKRVSPMQMAGRLFWNPVWNDALFTTSLAERIAMGQVAQNVAQLRRRVAWHRGVGVENVVFRLVFVHREGDAIVRNVTFQSGPAPP